MAIGNIWGGKLADKHGAVPALEIHFRRTVCSADGLPVTASRSMPRWLPFCDGDLLPSVTYRVTGHGTESGTPNHAVQMWRQVWNIAAANIGIALFRDWRTNGGGALVWRRRRGIGASLFWWLSC